MSLDPNKAIEQAKDLTISLRGYLPLLMLAVFIAGAGWVVIHLGGRMMDTQDRINDKILGEIIFSLKKQDASLDELIRMHGGSRKAQPPEAYTRPEATRP